MPIISFSPWTTEANTTIKVLYHVNEVIYLEKDQGKPKWSIKSGIEFTNKNIKSLDKPIKISGLTQEEIQIEKCETTEGCKIEEEESTRIRELWKWDANEKKTPADNFYKVKIKQEESKLGVLFDQELDAANVEMTGVYSSDSWKKPNSSTSITFDKKLFKNGKTLTGLWKVVVTNQTSPKTKG